MPTERITFAGHDGNQLAARLDLPDGPVLATALFAHCFTCSKDIPAARRISARLAAMGIAVLRFDFTGLGHSGGRVRQHHLHLECRRPDRRRALSGRPQHGPGPC